MSNLQVIGTTVVLLGDIQHCQYHCTLFLDRRKQIALTSAKSILMSELIENLEAKNFKNVVRGVINPLIRSKYLLANEKSVVSVNSKMLAKFTSFITIVSGVQDDTHDFSSLCKKTYRVLKCLGRQYRLDILKSIITNDYTIHNIVSQHSLCPTLTYINDLKNNNLIDVYKERLYVNTEEIDRISKQVSNFLHTIKQEDTI